MRERATTGVIPANPEGSGYLPRHASRLVLPSVEDWSFGVTEMLLDNT